MSVDDVFVRITATELQMFQADVDLFCDKFDDLLETISGADTFSAEIMWISEFTRAVLGNRESFFEQLCFPQHEFDQRPICGAHGYHLPTEVQTWVEKLAVLRQAGLVERLTSLQGGYKKYVPTGFANLLEYQSFWFHTIEAFFQEAARRGDAIVLVVY